MLRALAKLRHRPGDARPPYCMPKSAASDGTERRSGGSAARTVGRELSVLSSVVRRAGGLTVVDTDGPSR